LTHVLYTSTQAANNRDSPGHGGQVRDPYHRQRQSLCGDAKHSDRVRLIGDDPGYRESDHEPCARIVHRGQSITLSDSTPGAVIYYTTDGTTPTTGSLKYSSGTPVQISSTTTLKAIAAASGYSTSGVTSGTYTIASQGSTPIGVSLSSVDNIDGIAKTGSAVVGGDSMAGQRLRRCPAGRLDQLGGLELLARRRRHCRCREQHDHCAAGGE